MNRLSTFFQKADQGVGVFYPTNHIVAVFPTTVEAVKVKKELERSAPAVIAVTGEEMLEFATDQAEKAGLWGALMRELSSMIGTEEQYVEEDMKQAQKGAAFVAAYCPDEEVKANIWAVLRDAHPLAARYYATGGIEHLVGG